MKVTLRGSRFFMRTLAEVSWLSPYPDRLLDEMAPSEEEPEAVIVTRAGLPSSCSASCSRFKVAPAVGPASSAAASALRPALMI